MSTTESFNELTQLPNIGKVLAQRLIRVGITSAQQLNEFGYERIFLMIQAIDPGACIQELQAIAGAVWGIRTNQLTKEQKDQLLTFYRQAKKAV